jgi:hypothetical protein
VINSKSDGLGRLGVDAVRKKITFQPKVRPPQNKTSLGFKTPPYYLDK